MNCPVLTLRKILYLSKHIFLLQIWVIITPIKTYSQYFQQYFSIDTTVEIKNIAVRNDKQIVLGTNNGIFIFSLEKKTISDTIRGTYGKICHKLVSDSKGVLWAAISGNKIVQVDDPDFAYSLEYENKSIDIRAIYFDSSRIWIGTRNHGLLIGDLTKSMSIKLRNTKSIFKVNPGEIPPETIYVILVDSLSNKWIGTESGLFLLRDSIFSRSPSFPNFPILEMIESNGYIWVGGVGRIWRKETRKKKWESILNNSDVSNNAIGKESQIKDIKKMKCDNYGNLWIASNKIARLDINMQWRVYENLLSIIPSCLWIETDSIIWVATQTNGLLIDTVTPIMDRFSNANNLILLVDASGSVTNKTLKKIRRTVGLWIDFMEKGDRISIIGSNDFWTKQKVRDTVVIIENYEAVKSRAEILDSLDGIREKNGTKFEKTIHKSIEYTPNYLQKSGNNRIIAVTDGGQIENMDSVLSKIRKINNLYDVHFSVILYKKGKQRKIVNINRDNLSGEDKKAYDLTSAGGGHLYFINNSKRKIFAKEFKYAPALPIRPYLMAKSYFNYNKINNTQYANLNGDIGTNSMESTKKMNSFGIEACTFFNENSRKIILGIGVGLERTTYSLGFSLNNHESSFNSIDKDGDHFTKLIYVDSVNESIDLEYFQIPMTIKLKLHVTNYLKIFLDAGIKLPVYWSEQYNATGVYTFKGVYELYGGIKLPIFNPNNNPAMEKDYGFVTNKKFESSGDLETKMLKYSLCSSIGIIKTFKKIKKLSIGLGVSYLYSNLKYTPSESNTDYLITEGIDNYNTIFKSRMTHGLESFGIETSLAFRLSRYPK